MSIFRAIPERAFAKEEQIINCVHESNNFDPEEDLEKAGGFVLFDGAHKRVWLIATRLRLYSISDNKKQKGPRIDWSISRSKLYTRGALELNIREEKKGKDLVQIGYRRGCAFSPGLFTATALEEKILALLREKMG